MEKLHFLLIPLMSQSHIIPLTGFAKLLAKRGVTVSIITTPFNAKRYYSIVNLNIQLITVHFPCEEVGLPKGCENLDSLPSHDLFPEFFRASELLRQPLQKIISEMEPKPCCIISTNALSWTQDVATTFGIPRYIFQTVSCFSIMCLHILDERMPEGVVGDAETEATLAVPNVPDHIEFSQAQLVRNTFKNSDKFMAILETIKQSQDLARGSLINTFEELEPWYVNEYKKLKGRVWCVGPVSLSNKQDKEKEIETVETSNCFAWLDGMNPSSVIYVCFGSLCQISPSQLMEIGLGLEASTSPFIWVVRGPDLSPEIKKWFGEEEGVGGFEQRVRGKGLIVRGWAPQTKILSHPSVGGFLTHCGWNSTLEGVCAGVPMVTFPMFAEQFYNEQFIVNVLKIGERVGVEVNMNSWDEEKEGGVLVKREQVKRAIDSLMGGGGEGAEKRKRAKEMAEMAKSATGEEKGSSFLNISLLIQDVVMQMQMKGCHEI